MGLYRGHSFLCWPQGTPVRQLRKAQAPAASDRMGQLHSFLEWHRIGRTLLQSRDVSELHVLRLGNRSGGEIPRLRKIKSEVDPANRGNLQDFNQCPWHHSVLYSTDMPTLKAGRWILDKINDMNPVHINLIRNLYREMKLTERFGTNIIHPTQIQRITP